MCNSAGIFVVRIGYELGVSQEIESPVLVEGQIRQLGVLYLLAILQQFYFNLGRMKLRHVAVQEV